ncbi:MAG: radical SAM protein [Deltaproteobacteria bacterium]|nr:radical SAM protein [Deltaproteobacteria bacterium]
MQTPSQPHRRRTKAKFGAAYLRKWAEQRVAEALDRPEWCRPTQVCTALTSRCNFGCNFCPHPTAEVHHEMSLEQWKPILRELHAWLGLFRINFLGGEPMLHPEFFEILEFCRAEGILAGVTTNGSLLTEKNARRLAALEPFNVSISLDSIDPSKHDRNRDFKGSYAKIMRGLDYLNHYRSGGTRLCLRTTVMEWNVDELPDIADLARAHGTVVGFQPVEYRDLAESHASPADWRLAPDYADRTPNARFAGLSLDPATIPQNVGEHWVRNLGALDRSIAALVGKKRAGWPILNSVVHLESIQKYFHNPDFICKIDRECKTAWEHMIILPNGAIRSCSEQPTYGNLHQASLREIWTSEAARQHRDNCAKCERTCMNMFHWKRSIVEKASMFYEFF